MQIRTALVALVLLVMMTGVSAGTRQELAKLIEGKRTVYVGTCGLNSKGLVPEKLEDAKATHQCIVGVDMSEKREIYYMLICDNDNKPLKLLVVNKDTQQQTVVWTNATEA